MPPVIGAIDDDIEDMDIDDDMDIDEDMDDDIAPSIFLCFIFGIFDMLLDMLSDDIDMPLPIEDWAWVRAGMEAAPMASTAAAAIGKRARMTGFLL